MVVHGCEFAPAVHCSDGVADDDGEHCDPAQVHLWVALLPGTSDSRVEVEAAARDVLVSAGRHWFPAEASGPHLRLSFAGARAEWVDDAVRMLAEVVADADS